MEVMSKPSGDPASGDSFGTVLEDVTIDATTRKLDSLIGRNLTESYLSDASKTPLKIPIASSFPSLPPPNQE
jgi:hypothetical protein